MAIDGFELEAVSRAARNFMSGNVKGHNRAFAPSCAEFSDECRSVMAAILAERNPRLPEPKKADDAPPVSKWKMKLLRRAVNGDRGAWKELQEMFPHLSLPAAPRQQEQKEAAE